MIDQLAAAIEQGNPIHERRRSSGDGYWSASIDTLGVTAQLPIGVVKLIRNLQLVAASGSWRRLNNLDHDTLVRHVVDGPEIGPVIGKADDSVERGVEWPLRTAGTTQQELQ